MDLKGRGERVSPRRDLTPTHLTMAGTSNSRWSNAIRARSESATLTEVIIKNSATRRNTWPLVLTRPKWCKVVVILHHVPRDTWVARNRSVRTKGAHGERSAL